MLGDPLSNAVYVDAATTLPFAPRTWTGVRVGDHLAVHARITEAPAANRAEIGLIVRVFTGALDVVHSCHDQSEVKITKSPFDG